MLNYRLILKILGSLLFLESLFMVVCLVIAILYREDDMLSFTVSILILQMTAYILRYHGRNASNNMSRRDSFMVVTLTWVVFSLFGSLPYLIGGYIPGFTNAYFETMSGFTTTGATILDDVEHLPHAILFWRTFTQWIGGLGIVFFTVAILPSMVGGPVKVFSAEATGPIKTKLHPRLSTSAKSIWSIFIMLTIICMVTFKVLGMDWFDSVNYAMTTIATGGFSTHNDSVGFFNSIPIEYATTFFCFISGINFILLFKLITKGELSGLLSNYELRFYCILTATFTIIIMLLLMKFNDYTFEKAIRCSLFQVVSFITTTGLFNDDAAQWPHVTWIILAVCMFCGACAGSTSGGFKCIRVSMLYKVVLNEFRQMLHPKAVLPLRMGSVNIPMQQRVTLLAFLTVYCLLCIFCATVMVLAGVDNTNAITITISTLSNVGPTLGTEIGPVMSWDHLPDFAKWICSLLMLMGRLELLSVLIIFTPAYWKDQ